MKQKKIIKYFILGIIIFIPSVSVLFGEYLYHFNKLVGFYGNAQIQKSDLYIEHNSKKYYLYEDINNIKLGDYNNYGILYNYSDRLVIGDKNLPISTKSKLPGELIIYLSEKSEFENFSDFNKKKIDYLEKYEKLFGKSKLLKQDNGDEYYYWIKKDTILYLISFKNSNEKIGKNMYGLRFSLDDKRLYVFYSDSMDGQDGPGIYFSKSIVLPISRFGFFEKVWYLP